MSTSALGTGKPISFYKDASPEHRELSEAENPNVSGDMHPHLPNQAHSSKALSSRSLCQITSEAFPTEAYQASLRKRTGMYQLHNAGQIGECASMLLTVVLAMAVLERLGAGKVVQAAEVIGVATVVITTLVAKAVKTTGEIANAKTSAEAVEAVVEQTAVVTVLAIVLATAVTAARAAAAAVAAAAEAGAAAREVTVAAGLPGAAAVAVAAEAVLLGSLLYATRFIQPPINRAMTNLELYFNKPSEAPVAPLSREERSKL